MGLFYLILCYIVGSIPFSVLIGKCFYKKDIRTVGSKNPGTTNVLRTCGKLGALAVFILDNLKGGIMLLIGKRLGINVFGFDNPLIFGGAAILGHIYSIFLGFKGGKGAATSLGVLFFYNPLLGLAGLTVFILTLVITKYVSMGSMVTALFALIVMIVKTIINPNLLIDCLLILLIVSLIIIRHRSNIYRLIKHTENKFSFNKKK